MTIKEQQDFITQTLIYIKKYAPQYGITCYSAPLAQMCLESNYGQSELAKNAHNYSGLKYTSSVSELPPYIKIGSEQLANGQYVSSQMQWCNFSSMEKGVEGYFKFLNKPRYMNLKNISDPNIYLNNIKNDGYATSLQYVNNNIAVIDKWNLTQYDPSQATIEKKYYRVQCGAFFTRSNAETLSSTLTAKNFNNIIKYNNGIYLVQCGAFSSKANAEAAAQKIKNAGFNTYIKYE